MEAEQLLEHFDRVAEAPGSIAALRRFILDLAVRGKLVDQDPNDEPASELLKRIQSEKEQLVRIGKIKKDKSLFPVTDEEISALFYTNHCTYERLGNIAILQKGLTGIKQAQPGSFPLVVTAEERSSCDHFDFEGSAAIIPMVSSTGHGNASMKRLHYQEGKFALGNILCAVFPIIPQLISARFIYEYLTAFKEDLLVAQMIGTANVSLTINKISNIPIPIVSPANQERAYELMGLCDRLEAAQKNRENLRDRLVAASLYQLNQAADSNEEFFDRARFYFDNLAKLNVRSKHIKQLRQTIINLAMCGKLVRQDSNDESVLKLLERIKENKRNLSNSNGAKEQKKTYEVPANKIPYFLPSTWKWINFADLIYYSDAGMSPKTEGFPKSGDQWGVVKVSSVSWDRFNPDENKQLFSEANFPESAIILNGDFLISRANTSALVAKCVIVEDQPKNLILSDKIVRLHITEYCEKKFVYYVNNYASHAREYYASEASGTSDSMKNVSRPVIYALPIPLPPLAEQYRIVARIDELMILCDQLEVQLNVIQSDSDNLLETLLHKSL